MAQAGGASTTGIVQYTGVVDCFVRMPQLEGVSSLYKGFVPIAARKVRSRLLAAPDGTRHPVTLPGHAATLPRLTSMPPP
jgi:hypothetical protein